MKCLPEPTTLSTMLLLAAAPMAAFGAAPAGRPVGQVATPPTIAAALKSGTIEPASSAFVNATAVMPFAEGTIYHLYTAPERVTDIVLQPGEALSAVASGDTARWVIGDTTSGTGADKRVHVLIKPFAIGLATNLVITTDRRTYHVSVSSGRGASMAALSWIYPQDALIALQRSEEAAAVAAPVATGLDIDQLHFNYAVTGDLPSWRPLRAFDDGRQTYIEFPESLGVGEAPPLFLIDGKGEAQLVNYRLRGRYYVVDRIFDAAELRLGSKHQAVVRITRVGDSGAQDRAKRRTS